MRPTYFPLYTDNYKAIKHLSNDQLGRLLRAFYEYHLNDGGISIDKDIEIPFNFFQIYFDRHIERQKQNSEARSLAGKNHKGNQHTRAREMEQNGTNGTNGTNVPMEQNGTNGTNGTINKNENRNINKNNSIVDCVSIEPTQSKDPLKADPNNPLAIFDDEQR